MNNKPHITPSDRDYIIRTVIGEAANEPPEGQAAVAHVIMNRLSRNYGRTPTEIVLARGQFEPWATRRDELFSYAPESPIYSSVAKVVDGVIGGKTKDPTSGATHFLQEDTVRQRTGGALPDWARGTGLKIGAHTFHYPDEPDRPESRPRTASVLDKYTKDGAPTTSDVQPAPLAEGLSLVNRYAKKSTTVAVDPVKQQLDQLVPKPPESGRIEAPPIQGSSGYFDRQGNRLIKDFSSIGNALVNAPGEFLSSAIDNTVGGYRSAVEGGSEMMKGNILPTGKFTDTSTWQPGGALRTAGGVLQSIGGMTGIIPATEALENTVTQLTGSPQAGKSAGVIGNAVGPTALLRAGANRLRPTSRARAMVEESGLSPEELARLEANPRLTPMDVNPSLQGKAMGLATGEGGDRAKNLLYSRARDRAETAPGAVREAYTEAAGEAPIVTETLRQYKQTAKDNARKGFGEAFKGVQFVNAEPVIAKIDAILKPGAQAVTSSGTQVAWGPLELRLQRLRNELTDGQSVVTDPMRLHEIQYALGHEIRDLSKSAVGSERHLARDLGRVHGALVKQIDDATKGKYQPARMKFKEDMEIQEAFEKGFEVFDTGKGLAGQLQNSPSAWREWVTGKDTKGNKIGEAATHEELVAARLGARSEIDRRVQGFRNPDTKGRMIDDVPWNREKMELLFGKKEADRLHRLLQDEKDIATTNNRLLYNSKTAEAQANAKSIRPREPGQSALGDLLVPAAAEGAAWYLSGGSVPGITFGATMAARRIANSLGQSSDKARNAVLADFISLNPREGNRLMAPQSPLRLTVNKATKTLPLTYAPPEIRADKRVPMTQD